jgi:hypothetical protein
VYPEKDAFLRNTSPLDRSRECEKKQLLALPASIQPQKNKQLALGHSFAQELAFVFWLRSIL